MSTVDVGCPWCDEVFPVPARVEHVTERVLAIRVYQSDYWVGLLRHMYGLPATYVKGSRR